ncbi:hypothetical protein Gotur_020065 [Gossypium turneri]
MEEDRKYVPWSRCRYISSCYAFTSFSCCSTNEVKKYDKVNNSWSVVKRLPVRTDSSYCWGLAFKACRNSLLVIGAGGHGGHDDGVIVLHFWNPKEGNRDGQEWNVLAVKARAGAFVYNCAVMGY